MNTLVKVDGVFAGDDILEGRTRLAALFRLLSCRLGFWGLLKEQDLNTIRCVALSTLKGEHLPLMLSAGMEGLRKN
jgi:hypothetical protein